MTINRDQTDLNNLLAKAIQEVKEQGIKPGNIDPTLYVSNAAKEFGRCTHTGSNFEIRISKYIMNNPEKDLMQTIVHEVLHSVPGCMNHGAQWKKAAEIMNKAKGYDISRLTSTSAANLTKEHQAVLTRYVVACADCGNEIYRQRKSKLINYPELYTCGVCGGELERIR